MAYAAPVVELFPVDPMVLAFALLITFCASTIQSTIGFGFSIVAVPVLSLIDPALAPVPQLLVSLVLSGTVFLRERRDADFRGVGWIIAGQFPGIALGLTLLKTASPQVLDVTLSLLVLFAVAVVARGLTMKRTAGSQFLAGAASGAFNLVSSIGGPPLALLYHGSRGPEIRATLALIFTVGGVLSVGTRLAAGEFASTDFVMAGWYLPPLLLGVWASRWFAARVEGRPLRVAILVTATASAVGLLARAAMAGG